jgi:hypothetical protein
MAQAGIKGKNVNLFVSASRNSGDGYRDHTKFWANNGYCKLNWQPSKDVHLQMILAGTGFFPVYGWPPGLLRVSGGLTKHIGKTIIYP